MQGFGNKTILLNCPINFKDITNAKYIFGPYIAGMRGKQWGTIHTRWINKSMCWYPRNFKSCTGLNTHIWCDVCKCGCIADYLIK